MSSLGFRQGLGTQVLARETPTRPSRLHAMLSGSSVQAGQCRTPICRSRLCHLLGFQAPGGTQLPQCPPALSRGWAMNSASPLPVQFSFLSACALQTLTLPTPRPAPLRSPPCSGWQRSSPLASRFKGGPSTSSWSTCSPHLSAVPSAKHWRASSNIGNFLAVPFP